MPFMVQGKTNLKYVLIVVVLVAIAGGGILAYQYWWLPKQETKLPEITIKDETAQNPPETGCIDSDAQCEGKPDGTSCAMGVWCDESGNICGGESCVGLGTGECSGQKCVLAKDETALQNGEYLSESFNYCSNHNPEGEIELSKRIKLSDRIFRLPVPLEWGLGYEIRMTDAPVFGDLNDDGVEDALVILREYCGGNGNQGYLAAMINSHGSYQNVDVIALGKDRSSFNIDIESGFINVVACGYYETECDVYKIKLTNEKLEILETKTMPLG